MTILQQFAILVSLIAAVVHTAGVLPPSSPLLRPPHDHGFRYAVNDGNGNEHSHQQQQLGSVVTGQYKVLLPDGRLQTVTYIADERGYRAKVEYSPHHPGEGATAGLPSAANLRPPLIPIQQHHAAPPTPQIIIDNNNNRFPRPFQSLTALQQEQKQQQQHQLDDRYYSPAAPEDAHNNPRRRTEKKDPIFNNGPIVRQHQSSVLLISPERDGADHRFVPDYIPSRPLLPQP